MTAPPTKRLSGSRCLCRGCGEYFNSATTFDGHRVGAFGSVRAPGTRRCLTVGEMLARGWLQNAAGFWITGKRLAATFASRAGAAIVPNPYPTAGEDLPAPAPEARHGA